MSDTEGDLTEAWYTHAAAVEQKLGTMAEMFSQMVSGLNAQVDVDRDIRNSALAHAANYRSSANGGDTEAVIASARKFEAYIRGEK